VAELVSGVVKLPQIMVNVKVPDPAAVARSPALLSAISAKEADLADRGRILVRASGTEPLLRVMVEGEDRPEVQEIADELAAIAQKQG
jgi:phosphoglucosamine mutase